MVEEFSVDTSQARQKLGWVPTKSVEGSVRQLFMYDE